MDISNNNYINKNITSSNIINDYNYDYTDSFKINNNSFNIRLMTLCDLESIKSILATDFDNFWNYKILKEELLSDYSKYYIIENISSNEIVGFSGIKIVVDEAELMNIVIKKTYRNLGLASKLLEFLISICSKKSITSMFLEVSESNTFAQRLYNKFEFKQISVRENYYDNLSGIIMKKVLK